MGLDAHTSSENDAEVKTREPVSAVLFESGPAILWKVASVYRVSNEMPYTNCRKFHASDRLLPLTLGCVYSTLTVA